jgi:sulfoxide reductase heme-binding subunit YedZ
MSTTASIVNKKTNSTIGQILKFLGILGFVGIIFAGLLALLWFDQTPAGVSWNQNLQSLFAMDTVQAWWYVTRAAGLTSYFLLWLSMVWGLAIATKFFHPTIDGTYSYDWHEFLSLLGLGFVILHVVVLMLDQFLPFNILQILIPFVDTYRPFWVGLGIIGFYISILVTVTFYLRKIIGAQLFRCIHTLSLVGYLGATLHGLFAGTDSALPVAKILYGGTFLIVLFLTIYWVVIIGLNNREKVQVAQRQALIRNGQRIRQNQR